MVSVGLVRWIECVVKEPSYFKLCTETTPTHLALLDEVVSIHPLLHSRVLNLLIELFESEFQDLEILVQVSLSLISLSPSRAFPKTAFPKYICQVCITCTRGSSSYLLFISCHIFKKQLTSYIVQLYVVKPFHVDIYFYHKI